MVSPVELRRIAAFSKLPDDQIHWFLSHAQEVAVQAEEAFVRQGDPADWMFIFLDGLFKVFDLILFPGQVAILLT